MDSRHTVGLGAAVFAVAGAMLALATSVPMVAQQAKGAEAFNPRKAAEVGLLHEVEVVWVEEAVADHRLRFKELKAISAVPVNIPWRDWSF